MHTCLIYIRVSTDDQAQSGLGLEAQEAACRKFAEAQGLTVDRVLVESGVSRWTLPADRPAMAELLADVRRGQSVIALKVDRIGDAGPLALFNHALKKTGARLLLVNGDNSGSVESLFINELMGVLASHECRQISARTKAALAAKRARGEAVTGRVYGFRIQSGKLSPDERELAVIDRILALAAEGRSWAAIARTLNAEKIPAPAGADWHARTCQRIAARASAA